MVVVDVVGRALARRWVLPLESQLGKLEVPRNPPMLTDTLR
jgi:hypothetical protein